MRSTKLKMRNTYRIENKEIIIGFALPVFICNLNYHLTEIQIFKDGKIDCWGLVGFSTRQFCVANKFCQGRTGEEGSIFKKLNDSVLQ